MRKMPEKIVLIGRTRRHLVDLLSEMGIPALPLERRGAVVMVGQGREDTDRLRPLGERPWAVAPGLILPPNALSFVQATLRTRSQDFHELLARHLAWRIWHDC